MIANETLYKFDAASENFCMQNTPILHEKYAN